ncbi:MAG: UDP-N-acetylmuramate--L-alanine ligase [Spirochaetia bacterium]
MDYDGAMEGVALPQSLSEADIYMVGIKGTGMAALAEILVAGGAHVTGSDTAEKFYTDDLLRSLGLRYAEGFAASNLPDKIDLVVYSVAYDPARHEELVAAASRGLPMITYAEALGKLSGSMPSIGIAGVHGKTTTAALCAVIARAAGLPGIVLAGSTLSDLGGRATLVQGQSFFIAETCEYRRSFLSFRPVAIVVTSIEADHLDYFQDRADIFSAFEEYARSLPPRGELIYCADDDGARELAESISRERPDIRTTGYGECAEGEGRVVYLPAPLGEIRFSVGRRPFALRIPGRHNALNAAAALIATDRARQIARQKASEVEFAAVARDAVSEFHGTRRRSEIVGDADGVLILDDYAHHPTAIAATIAGYREFYPGRRLVLDFMAHTYSRTKALLGEFGKALSAADILILHEIYASAREENPGDVNGEQLAEAARRYVEDGGGAGRRPAIHFVKQVMDALPLVERIVQPGDLFVTMGAGNNWELGRALLGTLRQREETP